MYGMMCSRPDLTHVVTVVSRFIADLERAH